MMITTILRTALLAVLAVLLAAGCGGDPEPVPVETVPDTPDLPMEPQDVLDLSSPGLTACTLSVTPDGPEWEISLMWSDQHDAAEGFNTVHTVYARLIDGSEGQTFEGLEANISNVMDLSGYLITEDMDFDGYTDFRLMESPTAGPNTYWLFWLYHQASGRFYRADGWDEAGLVSPEFDTEEELIRCFSRNGYGLYTTQWFSVEESLPVLVREERTEWVTDDSLVMVTSELVDGTMVETGQVPMENE